MLSRGAEEVRFERSPTRLAPTSVNGVQPSHLDEGELALGLGDESLKLSVGEGDGVNVSVVGICSLQAPLQPRLPRWHACPSHMRPVETLSAP